MPRAAAAPELPAALAEAQVAAALVDAAAQARVRAAARSFRRVAHQLDQAEAAQKAARPRLQRHLVPARNRDGTRSRTRPSHHSI